MGIISSSQQSLQQASSLPQHHSLLQLPIVLSIPTTTSTCSSSSPSSPWLSPSPLFPKATATETSSARAETRRQSAALPRIRSSAPLSASLFLSASSSPAAMAASAAVTPTPRRALSSTSRPSTAPASHKRLAYTFRGIQQFSRGRGWELQEDCSQGLFWISTSLILGLPMISTLSLEDRFMKWYLNSLAFNFRHGPDVLVFRK